MLISNLIIGIFFIILSIIVLVFPNTIAGYNTLKKEEKGKIKKKELARFSFIILFSVGINNHYRRLYFCLVTSTIFKLYSSFYLVCFDDNYSF